LVISFDYILFLLIFNISGDLFIFGTILLTFILHYPIVIFFSSNVDILIYGNYDKLIELGMYKMLVNKDRVIYVDLFVHINEDNGCLYE
jgi:hypothetical protein